MQNMANMANMKKEQVKYPMSDLIDQDITGLLSQNGGDLALTLAPLVEQYKGLISDMPHCENWERRAIVDELRSLKRKIRLLVETMRIRGMKVEDPILAPNAPAHLVAITVDNPSLFQPILPRKVVITMGGISTAPKGVVKTAGALV